MTTAAIPTTSGVRPAQMEHSRVRAMLQLDFERDSTSGDSFLAGSLQEPPLKVVRAFTLADGAALVHLHNVSGGLLGGDHLSLRVNAGIGTKVQLTTTSATRIYRHRPEFSRTIQSNRIIVGENALLEYVPDAIIPFGGSRFLQETEIRLAAGAGFYWWEIVAPGREARGELFEYEQFEMRTRINAPGRMIAGENICLNPAMRNIASNARMGPYRYAATFYICAVGRDAGSWRAAEEHVRLLTTELTKPGETVWGVSTLIAHGLVIRCVARNGRNILPELHAIWKRAKLHIHGYEAIPPRKVN